MPFVKTPSRSQDDLIEFFEFNLKKPIEEEDFKYRYVVKRSDDTFNIGEQIIRDLYNSDIVLCDLSGKSSNPNVMYELGARLSLTHKPVILFREKNDNNRKIFDISGFFTYEYSPHKYRLLESHIIDKIRKLESGEEIYSSPMLNVLKYDPNIVHVVNRQRNISLLKGMARGFNGYVRTVGGAFIQYLINVKGVDIEAVLEKDRGCNLFCVTAGF